MVSSFTRRAAESARLRPPRRACQYAARRSARLLRGRAEPEPDARRARRPWRALRAECLPRTLDDAVDGFDPDRPLPDRDLVRDPGERENRWGEGASAPALTRLLAEWRAAAPSRRPRRRGRGSRSACGRSGTWSRRRAASCQGPPPRDG